MWGENVGSTLKGVACNDGWRLAAVEAPMEACPVEDHGGGNGQP
jgi:hypothetical protein